MRVTVVGCVMLTLVAGCASDASTGTAPAASLGRVCESPTAHTGEATFYGADGTGNCSFDAAPDLMVAAMNQEEYGESAACGACVRINGPDGSVTVRIVDRCPECPRGNLDLSREAFAKIADPARGRVPINWTVVSCTLDGPIRYRFKEGSNQWWTAVQVRNSRHAIERFEVEKNGAFVAVPRLSYNYFVDASGMGPGPFRFRVTDSEGNVLTDSSIPLGDGTEVAGAAQFPACAQ